MCRWKTEGTSYTKCGHYIQTKWIEKIDCGSTKCAKSDRHPQPCMNCSRCDHFFDPDEEKITGYSDKWCHLCEPWYGDEARKGKKQAR